MLVGEVQRRRKKQDWGVPEKSPPRRRKKQAEERDNPAKRDGRQPQWDSGQKR